MTSSTTSTLIEVMIVETRLESLMPSTRTTVRAPMTSTAPQSNVTGPSSREAAVLLPPNSSPRYCAQLFDTTAAPRAYSRMRSQPMIQAMNSPNVA